MRVRDRAAWSIAAGIASAPTPAHADPISVAILAALGTSTATALAVAVVTFALTTIASLVVSKLLSPRAKAQDRQASILSLQIGESTRMGAFGTVGLGGSLADGFNYGGDDGTDWEVLVIALADHRCHSLEGFYVGEVYVPFTGDGPVDGYYGQLEVYWLEGTEDQVMPSVVTTEGGWSAEDNLAGIATVVVAYKADDPESEAPIWTAGRPQFTWVVKGKLCYIPRLDSTVEGGAGSHRWNDPSTWEWTDNVIDCRYNWQRGIYACDRVDEPGMLLVGRGLSEIEAPPERTIAAANTCDELVPLAAGGSEKRYTCNAVVMADEEFIAIEEMFAATCAGVIVQRQGGVEIEPGAARSVVAEITDSDLIVGEQVVFNRFKSDNQRTNSVIGRYIEPSQKWADHAAPIRRSLGDVIADGGPREETLSLPAVTSGTQAQRCAEIRRRMSRLERSGGFTLGPRFAHLEEGDWIGWTSARHLQGERAVFRITRYSLPSSWRNSITFEEISADCFDWDVSDEIADTSVAEQQAAPPPDEGPDVADWSLSVVSFDGGGQVALHVEGGVSSSSVAMVVIDYRIEGDTDWIAAGVHIAGLSNVSRDIGNVSPDTDYQVSIRYRFKDFGLSTRLILEETTSTGGFAPSPASALSVTPSSGAAEVEWRNPASANFGYCIVYRSTTGVFSSAVDVSGPVYGGLSQVMVYTDTLPAGTYFWWVKAFSADAVDAAAVGPVSATVT